MSFKICPNCKKEWETQEKFLSDSEIKIIGYKADFEKLEYGLFFFNHLQNECKSTITIDVLEFRNIYKGSVSSERGTGLDGCPGYCLDRNQLERCNELCECAYVRDIIQVIKGYPKK
jgi:hypothetical protein